MKRIATVVLLFLACNANAQSFKIEEQTDMLTKETYISAGILKLCQTKNAGIIAKCAQLKFAWNPKMPKYVAVRIDIPDIASVLNVSVNIKGTIQTFDADEPTDIQPYYEKYTRSGNTFIMPLEALRALCSDPNYGIMRVSGTHSSYDYDFWRKAKMKGLPSDELREFLDKISEKHNN